jgi:hypothetical protein
MENSFYYFFSATPQVLAAVLALFGVFVIFKIQTIKSELLSFGQIINSRVEYFISRDMPKMYLMDNYSVRSEIKTNVYKCIQSQDMKFLNVILYNISDEVVHDEQLESDILQDIKEDTNFLIFKHKFIKEYSFLQDLIDDTISFSKITAVIIVICLIAIPIGNILLCQTVILYTLFGFIVVSMSYCFYGLITILKKSLND